MTTVPDDLLLAFFRDSSSRLLEINPETATENSDGYLDISGCRRCVLDQQRIALREVTTKFQEDESSSLLLSVDAVQERLGGLNTEPNLSQELKAAMEDMNDAARVGLCKLVLYNEETADMPNRILQAEGKLDRTKLMEYFVLCRSSLKLEAVANFMSMTGGDLIFDAENSEKSSSLMFPQARLERVQRLLAKAIGWDPVFVTAELKKIFVIRPADVDYDYYDREVMALFNQLVQEMQSAIRAATLRVQSKQDTQLMNDLGKGGNTRVVSVQYSEFEVDQHGNTIKSENNAPQARIDERLQVSEEDQKRQLRMASQAALLQQSMLGDLLSMAEDQRNDVLKEAAEESRKFMKECMELPLQQRIDFLRSVDPETSRKLAMHKLWEGMLQANGGKPPTMVARNNNCL